MKRLGPVRPASIKSMRALDRAVKGCRNCLLSGQCRAPVVGVGPVPCDIMLLGEAPGQTEDEQGVPFVGKSGQALDAFLEVIGIRRASVRISNVVHCWPKGEPTNRPPTELEIKSCRPWLEAEIALVRPRVIVALGATALNAVILKKPKDKEAQVAYSIGRCFEGIGNTIVVPCWHPAYYLLKNATQLVREDFGAALRKAVRIVNTKSFGGAQ